MKTDVVVIGGGNTFENRAAFLRYLRDEKEPRFETMMQKDWKDALADKLGPDFRVITPSMPNKQSAAYDEWEIWFQKHIPHFNKQTILIGHSLGGIFLTKFLAENNYPKEIHKLILVAAPYDDKDADFTLGNFSLPTNLSRVTSQASSIHIFQSADDPVVNKENANKYANTFPQATLHMFDSHAHFNDENFPELIDVINSNHDE